jgi:hypothetical protein
MLVEIDRGAPQIVQAGIECLGQIFGARHRRRRELRCNENLLALRKLAQATL